MAGPADSRHVAGPADAVGPADAIGPADLARPADPVGPTAPECVAGPADVADPADPVGPAAVRPDRTYLITGGFGSLGLLSAERLAAHGARHLVLMSRRVPGPVLAALRERLGPHVEVVPYAGDVGREEDVRRLDGALRARPQPLGGILHAAGVLADAPVAAQTWESLDAVFRAKVYGSWLLHRASLHHPELEFFVGYSSMASVLGSRGQANYGAGNAFLDTLLCHRYAAGLPGMSVNWGAWGGIGMAASMAERHIADVEHQGLGFFEPAAGMRALLRLLSEPVPQVGIAEVDWDRVAATRPLPDALYAPVARGAGRSAAAVDLAALLRRPRADRREAVSLVVRGVIAELLHFDGPEDVPPDARFFEVGLDSLAAVDSGNAEQGTAAGNGR
ncbi:SDR family oxidoreductase [Streptomyces pactum]|uniref:SDR family oxidoreductase n=1 Tax=Streptomyces pactum TaxID=68249 RepID=A0ABS0NH59_9ACTN|nr:SDR family oxidoreductase [Streptomyces pactum]